MSRTPRAAGTRGRRRSTRASRRSERGRGDGSPAGSFAAEVAAIPSRRRPPGAGKQQNLPPSERRTEDVERLGDHAEHRDADEVRRRPASARSSRAPPHHPQAPLMPHARDEKQPVRRRADRRRSRVTVRPCRRAPRGDARRAVERATVRVTERDGGRSDSPRQHVVRVGHGNGTPRKERDERERRERRASARVRHARTHGGGIGRMPRGSTRARCRRGTREVRLNRAGSGCVVTVQAGRQSHILDEPPCDERQDGNRHDQTRPLPSDPRALRRDRRLTSTDEAAPLRRRPDASNARPTAPGDDGIPSISASQPPVCPCRCRRTARAACGAGSGGRSSSRGGARTRGRARSARPTAATARPWICAQPVMPGFTSRRWSWRSS